MVSDLSVRTFRFAIEKGVAGEQGKDELLYAAAALDVGLVGAAQGGCVAECFVAAHEVAKGVAHEDLADA